MFLLKQNFIYEYKKQRMSMVLNIVYIGITRQIILYKRKVNLNTQ